MVLAVDITELCYTTLLSRRDGVSNHWTGLEYWNDLSKDTLILNQLFIARCKNLQSLLHSELASSSKFGISTWSHVVGLIPGFDLGTT